MTANLFAGVATCTCGEPMNKIKSRVDLCYLHCRGKAMNHGCKQPIIRYEGIEQSFLQIIGDDMHLFLDKKEDNTSLVASLRGKISSIQYR